MDENGEGQNKVEWVGWSRVKWTELKMGATRSHYENINT